MDRLVFTIKVLVIGWVGFVLLAGLVYLLAWFFQQNEWAFAIGLGTLFLIVFGWTLKEALEIEKKGTDSG